MKLSLKELERCIDLPATTIERWIRQGRIPVHKIGNSFVFKKETLQKWAASHHLSLQLSSETSEKKRELSEINLVSAMQYGGVHYDIEAPDRDQTLKNIVQKVPDLTPSDQDLLFTRLIERENLSSTGIGKGVAIPHPRTPLEDNIDTPLISTFFLNSPVDFGSVDDRPVFVIFLLLCPSVKIHLQLLSRLSFCIRHDAFVQFLKSKPSQEDLLGKISDFECQLDT